MKKILGLIVTAVVTIIAVVNINIAINNNVLSDLSLANVEALANWEFHIPFYDCYYSYGCIPDSRYDCNVYVMGQGYFFNLGVCTLMRG